MIDEIEIFLNVKPVPKGRPRFTRGGIAYTPKKTKTAEKEITVLLKNELNKKGASFKDSLLSIDLTFCYLKPKAKIRYDASDDGLLYKKTRPDLDNLAKLVLDAMNNVVYDDDSQVCLLNCKKIYSDREGIILIIKILG